ncbi:hypothetical protein DFR29_1346 [Tahibacter aquaticus]|uniref:Uncharacterized protein n=1 Tax=Tahibacter aquaticus TaxID=520092 RepID=A0A4R6YGQ7_9GAMM|nr:hypothetical protein DFR29_1346 [Tahibacter aquaticus]
MPVPHEITSAFSDAQLPLCRALAEMLDEHFVHRTERRGCGYTQATRFLSDFVNRPRDPVDTHDLRMFADWPMAATEALGQHLVDEQVALGWRALLALPTVEVEPTGDDEGRHYLLRLRDALQHFHASLALEESHLFLALLSDVLTGCGQDGADLPGMIDKPKIGSCSQAEEYFLEIAHGRVRRGGSVNTIVGPAGQPILLEKVGLGEAHSAIVIAPVRIFGVTVPPGSLCALRYNDTVEPGQRARHGWIFPAATLHSVRFLRLTTLVVSPAARRRAFSQQMELQARSNMFSPMTTTIEHLVQFARGELSAVSA